MKRRLRWTAIVGALAILPLMLIEPALAGDGASAEIKFTGTVSAVGPPVTGARWWNVIVEDVISGPAPCSGELYVHLHIYPHLALTIIPSRSGIG
jgi:hypothetical protein